MFFWHNAGNLFLCLCLCDWRRLSLSLGLLFRFDLSLKLKWCLSLNYDQFSRSTSSSCASCLRPSSTAASIIYNLCLSLCLWVFLMQLLGPPSIIYETTANLMQGIRMNKSASKVDISNSVKQKGRISRMSLNQNPVQSLPVEAPDKAPMPQFVMWENTAVEARHRRPLVWKIYIWTELSYMKLHNECQKRKSQIPWVLSPKSLEA